MTIDPAIFRALVAQGATPEMLLAVVEADAAVREEKLAKKRADTAARVAKHRAGKAKAGSAGNALQRVTERYGDTDLPPNDIYSNPPSEPSGAKAPEPPFAEKVVEAWNAGPAARGATKAQKLDAGRRKHLANRVREHGQDGVLQAIRGIEVSDFHCGIGEKSYRTNLGWLLKSPEHFLAAMERAETAKPATAPACALRTDADRAAYLASLESKPWANGSARPEPPPRPPGQSRGPQPIGGLIAHLAPH